MSEYIKQWLEIIENMNNDNTYKLAWGRALLELIVESSDAQCSFTYDEISLKMLKYYWNQLYFFDLKQGPGKKPVIASITEICIQYFQEKKQSKIPVWFDYAVEELQSDSVYFKQIIQKISTTLNQNVSWRFKIIHGNTIDLYELNQKQRTVSFTLEQVKELKDFSFVLSQLLNYRWAQLLETFNTSPKIASKVKGISASKLRRSNLSKFKHLLLLEMEEGVIKDFYTGEILKAHEISIDHVIPWSFMYSDDIWNLVITTKSMNSSKGKTIPNEEIIERLEQRNQRLMALIPKGHEYLQLQSAITNHYVRKFYIASRM